MASTRVNAEIAGGVGAAIGASRLRNLPPDLIARLTAEARRVHIEAGGVIHPEGETEPHLELVTAGLVRACVSAPDGRTMTVRYCRPGALLGVATLFADATRPGAVQALTHAELLRLRPVIVRSLATKDVRVACALLAETSDRVLAFVAELSGNAFASVRQRLARHLLDLAAEHQRGGDLIVHVTQQELADAIGTVREVVVRALRDLRQEGIVRTGNHGITILEPERLFGVTELSRWNVGS
jgi:CRP/FNR family cyclic AMP-dependent transcriptional regulator